MTIIGRAVDGEELGEVAEDVLPQLNGPRDLPVDLGVKVGFNSREEQRQKRIPRRVVVVTPPRLANEVEKAFRGQIFGVMGVADERPPKLGVEVLREGGIGCHFDLGRARVEFAIGRLLKRSGHDAPFGSNGVRARKPPGLNLQSRPRPQTGNAALTFFSPPAAEVSIAGCRLYRAISLRQRPVDSLVMRVRKIQLESNCCMIVCMIYQ